MEDDEFMTLEIPSELEGMIVPSGDSNFFRNAIKELHLVQEGKAHLVQVGEVNDEGFGSFRVELIPETKVMN